MKIGIVGAPVDLGADRRGVDMGPSAIRYAGLAAQLTAAGHDVRDFGNIPVPVPESVDEVPSDLKYLHPIVTMADTLAHRVGEILEDSRLPLVLGGDHSMSLGSVAGVRRHRKIGIVWLDAHGDFNTSATSPSGNIHGMVLSALAGYGDERLVHIAGPGPKVEASHVALIGVRELDPGERLLLQGAGVHIFTMHEIDRIGLPAVIDRVIHHLDAEVEGIHLSLDLDVVDPFQAPGVGTPVLGGLSYRETHLAMELLAETERIVSMDVVEVNPVLDNHNETARLGMQFALSALGKRIL